MNFVYSYSRCSTCRKALLWLKNNKIPHEVIDILEAPPSEEVLGNAFAQLNTLKPMFNTSGLSYRALGSKVVKAMEINEAIKALSEDPKLIKRPLLITSNGEFIFGFKEEVWAELLL